MVDFSPRFPQVPSELAPLVDNQFMQTQERWQDATFDEVVPERPTLTAVDLGNEVVRIAELPAYGEADGSVVALAFPFQQHLNDTMTLRAAFMQQAVMPNSSVLLLPNVHRGPEQTFTFSKEDKARMAEGSLAPLGEKYVRVFEKLRISDISLTGYSQGARTALDIAAVGSDKLEVVRVNADELPSALGRGAIKLLVDFMQSGGEKEQLKSMGESGFGSLIEAYGGKVLKRDYSEFGKMFATSPVSWAIHRGMTGSANDSLRKALVEYPDLQVKLGVVEDSRLAQLEDLTVPQSQKSRVKAVRYTGAAANKHTTGDNYAAHALMVKHGLKTSR